MRFKPKKFKFDKIKKQGFRDDDWWIQKHTKRYGRDRLKEVIKRENRRIKKILSKWKELYTYNSNSKADILVDMIAFGPYTPDVPASVIKEMLTSPNSLKKFFGPREKTLFGTFDRFLDYLRDWVELVEIYERKQAREKR